MIKKMKNDEKNEKMMKKKNLPPMDMIHHHVYVLTQSHGLHLTNESEYCEGSIYLAASHPGSMDLSMME